MMQIEGVERRRAIMDDAKTRETAEAAEPLEPRDALEITKLGESIGEACTSQSADSPESADDTDWAVPVAPSGAKKNIKFHLTLKITQPIWLIVATLLMGLVTLLIFGRAKGRNKAAREIRYERTVESLTPASLVAKCGLPSEDATKDLYPMIKRTVSYKSSGKGTVALEFSRTSEEKSEWVFLSMSDENGATYSTPETQIAAMPCLNSTK
jgi:hypothetical protein